jgi:hypothetical protein
MMLSLSMFPLIYARAKSSPKWHLIRPNGETLCGQDVVGKVVTSIPPREDLCLRCVRIYTRVSVPGAD